MVKKSVKNLFLNISILILVVFLFLAIFEIILSQTFIKASEFDVFKEGIILEGDTPYKPNAYAIFEGSGDNRLDPTIVKINSQGLRDYEYSVEKPVNTFRILGFGDSFTWGHGVELNETYLKQLEMKLNSIDSGLRYEVINFGIGGHNTQESVKLLKMKGLAYKPDMIILFCSPNDVKLARQMSAYGPVEQKPKIAKKPFVNERYISHWLKVKIHPLKMEKVASKIEDNPHEFWNLIEASLTELAQMAMENNFPVVLYSMPSITSLEEYEKFALEHNFYTSGCFSNQAVCKDSFKRVPSLTLKDGHPNPLGHELIAEELYNTLISNDLILVKKMKDL